MTWLKSWWAVLKGVFGLCPHERVRCIHGDEILAAGMKRSKCLDCGTALPPLPKICSVTGRPH